MSKLDMGIAITAEIVYVVYSANLVVKQEVN